jgi:glycosyltransferase involved in cell wall biosynthesis
MKNAPLVSIVIPCHNYGRFLEETIHSVIAQTLSDWECLIIDDGSTDNSKDIITSHAEHDSRFHYFYQKNKGPNAARNLGLSKARGTYMQLLDADDLLEQRKIELHAKYLEGHPSVDAVLGLTKYFRGNIWNCEEHLTSVAKKTAFAVDRDNFLEYLIKANIMAIHAPLFRRTLVDSIGLLNEGMRYLEDWEYWLRCSLASRKFQFMDSPDTAALVRLHDTNASHKCIPMLDAELSIRRSLMKCETPIYIKEYNEANALARLGIRYMKNMCFRKGMTLYCTALARSKRKSIIVLYMVYDFISPKFLDRVKSWPFSRWVLSGIINK